MRESVRTLTLSYLGKMSEEQKPPRKRINYSTEGRLPAIADPKAFSTNLSSVNAKQIGSISYSLNMQVWIDKHYQSRKDHGDEFGKREGIEQDKVESLVKRAIPHLILYSSLVPKFYFINHKNNPIQKYRVTLKEIFPDYVLNVVIEAHYINLREIEITVVTAKSKDDYMPYEGEYAIEIEGGSSYLTKNNNGKLEQVFEI